MTDPQEPKTQVEPQGARLAKVSGFDALTSLSAYLSAPGREQALDMFSDWLRDRANAILIDEAGSPRDLFDFGKKWLNEKLLFGPAARTFALALKKYGGQRDPFSNRIRQQWALATYKDEEAPPRSRFEAALAILDDVKALPEGGFGRDAVLADWAETCALSGAVYRRMFDLDGDLPRLHQALDCYRQAHECDLGREVTKFEGYGGLNAAFLLDALAFRLEGVGKGAILSAAASQAREESAELRSEIIARLTERLDSSGETPAEWLCETMAGACLGLGLSRWSEEPAAFERVNALLEKARVWTEKAFETNRADWKLETTYAQWLRVAYLNEPAAAARAKLYWEAARKVINHFRERAGGIRLTGPQMALNARLGKVGLALSGGGFRASFYHIGVLARLAEADILRHVDVLSTVSGGSIVGAHYYVLLRDLLQRKADPSRVDYIELVQRLEAQFSAAVHENLRMRGLSNFSAMLKLLFKPHYTRSDRMAELYDEYFYAAAIPNTAGPVRMNSLRIQPQGETGKFNPRFGNWRRSARAPALLINATSLNTGHSWHFTANWMGEPPELIDETVDKNERLRRVPYGKAGPYNAGPCKDPTLGFAVAASACVPGIFEPVRLSKLYPGRLVRLVDGGVHDNQGVDGLIGQGCDFIFCSDASGQMGDESAPPNGPVSTPSRSMNILMKRVREAEHGDLVERVAVGAGRNLFFVHLKAELPADDVDWTNCDDPTPATHREAARYGIDHQIQRHLSEIRTDLDSFSEVEASSLMVSGYLMASKEFERCVERIAPNNGGDFRLFDISVDRTRWGFLRLENKMKLPPDAKDVVRADLCRQLTAGHSLFFKNLLLAPRWKLAAAVLLPVVLVLACLIAAIAFFGAAAVWGAVWAAFSSVAAVAAIALIAVAAFPAARVWCFESFFALFGFFGSNAYFKLEANQRFLKRGGLERLLDLK